MIRFSSPGRLVVWRNGHLIGDATFVSFVQRVVDSGSEVAFNYWAPVRASLQDAWSAYLTVGSSWSVYFNEVPAVLGVPTPPGGYEPEGPVAA